ncbi:MAG: hypothetical protein OEO77_09610, partial [Acidimicrobiia bacterium]|nr:hypothetical protein [Acidimicrobiia bacterium]
SGAWVGRVGLVTAALEEAFAGLDAPTVFMCGPDPMMAAVGPLLVAGHVVDENLWVTMERNMKCSIGLCGHCQFGPFFVCKDGPVFSWHQVGHLFEVKEL